MYMDGMVLRGQPDVDLITSMGPYLDEFASIVELPYSEQKKTSQETTNSGFWNANLKPTDQWCKTSLYKPNLVSANMDNHNSKPTAIIVGSGPGGLASALLLAHSGVKVTVLEKADAVGGRTRLFKKDGYTFDRGPTFFHYPEVIEEIFQAIGRDAHKELGLMPLDPMYRLVFGAGGHIDATSDLDQMTERICLLYTSPSPRDGLLSRMPSSA